MVVETKDSLYGVSEQFILECIEAKLGVMISEVGFVPTFKGLVCEYDWHCEDMTVGCHIVLPQHYNNGEYMQNMFNN